MKCQKATISVLAMLLIPTLARAEAGSEDMPSHFKINDRDPEADLPTAEEANKRPLEFGYYLQELEARAGQAEGSKDWKKAVQYHRALARLVPDRAAAFSALCRDYEQLGDRAHALAACTDALGREGARVEDHLRFVRIVANRPQGLDAKEMEDALAVVEHLKENDSTRAAAYELQCELSMRSGDRAALSECSSGLAKFAPGEAKNIPFHWAAAMGEGDVDRARALVAEAKQKGLAPEAIARMERGLQANVDDTSEAVGASLVNGTHPMLRWVAGLLAAVLVGVLMARRLTRANSA